MTLNLNPEPASRKKSKSYKKTLRIGGAVSLVGVGSTFAANISLNSDQNVEFGQGVAQTLSCDDEVNINPVSYYDNTSGTFRLDYVEVSGLNLIPIGAVSDSYNSSTGAYDEFMDSTAIAAHPGQYYDSDSNAWANTCDQVVLDFKAFTNDTRYSTNTVDGYTEIRANENSMPNTISTPLFWAVYSNNGVAGHVTAVTNPNMAIVFDADNDGSNKASAIASEEGYANFEMTRPSRIGGTGYVKDSSFRWFPRYGHYSDALDWGTNQNVDPASGAISRITVESMRYFPSDYQVTTYNGNELGVRPTS